MLFDKVFASGEPGLPGYDVSLDGERFLMVRLTDAETARRPIHLILNWFDELRRLTAGRN
jgi:hypothetical protein